MGYRDYPKSAVDLSFSSTVFRKAVFGLSHVAFVDDLGEYVLPEEDRPSLAAALSFYQNDILKLPTYPVTDGKTFAPRETNSPIVLEQVLGLPHELFERLDRTKDILAQLRFGKNLALLKRQAYRISMRTSQERWYRDDFSNYRVQNGLFFPYDETKPFVQGNESHRPVFLDESKLPKRLKELVDTAKSDRFVIELMSEEPEPKLYSFMKEMDAFPFTQRVGYFVNGQFDSELSLKTAPARIKEAYGRILRTWLSHFVNVLFDVYSLKFLHRMSDKTSYLMPTPVPYQEKPVSVLSSFGGEMVSCDGGKTYRFEKQALAGYSKILEDVPENTDPVLAYQKLGLPYEGFAAFRKGKGPYPQRVRLLPSTSVLDESLAFQAAKRYDRFYSYLFGTKEHLHVFLTRRLAQEGIEYRNEDEGKGCLDLDAPYTLVVKPARRSGELRALFDVRRKPLSEEILEAYLLSSREGSYLFLREALKKIDAASHQEALTAFYYGFRHVTIRQAVLNLLSRYGLGKLYSEELVTFFRYVFFLPYQACYLPYAKAMREEGQTAILLFLDRSPDPEETYEPNLPLPFVSFGSLAYSFRNTYFGKAYVCSCEKEAVDKRIAMLGEEYDRSQTGKTSERRRNTYIVQHLGLPKNITDSLRLTEDLGPQIPYQDGVCHLCQHAEPVCHSIIDGDRDEIYNVFSTYLTAEAQKHGVLIDHPFYGNGDFVTDVFHALSSGNFHGVFRYRDPDPLLEPYLRTDPQSLLSLLLSVHPFFVPAAYVSLYEQLCRLSPNAFRDFFFHGKSGSRLLLSEPSFILTAYSMIYRMLEFSYSVEVSKKWLPDLEDSGLSLNLDHCPKLPLPYVHLGRVFNAYTDDPATDRFFFCSCDKESMAEFLPVLVNLLKGFGLTDPVLTIVALCTLGLPYRVVLKYQDAKLSTRDPKAFVNQVLPFKNGICRRCQNVAHKSYDEFLTFSFPHKDDHENDFDNALNGLAHDHLLVLTEWSLSEVRFDPKVPYDLEGYSDNRLPSMLFYGINPPESAYTFFHLTPERLSDLLFRFAARAKDKAEVVAVTSGVLLDAAKRNPDVFVQFAFERDTSQNFQRALESFFPEAKRVRKEIYPQVLQTILGFITFLFENFFGRYAKDEEHIGR